MADNRIAYGLAAKNGIDTKGMSPKEVWEALKGKGITPESVDKDAQGKQKELENKFDQTETINPKIKRLKNGVEGAEKFHSNMEKAKGSIPIKDRWRVDIHESSDYKNDKLFTTDLGSCVAIEPSGNIISVCRSLGEDDNVRGSDLLKVAIKNGGDRLDAFGKKLYNFYVKNGFEPISWTPFDKNYAPDGWKPEYGEEPVVFYRYVGKKYEESYEDFFKRVKESKDYDHAQEIRDREIKQ